MSARRVTICIIMVIRSVTGVTVCIITVIRSARGVTVSIQGHKVS
jgi:hypothetical protein